MYQVISVRVLRQALDWMGIPAPWFRTTDFMRWPDGRLTSTIKCMWNFREIADWYDATSEVEDHNPGEGYTRDAVRFLAQKVHDAFCDDIQIVNVSYNGANHWFVAYLTCTIQPHNPDPFPLDEKWIGYPERFDL